MQLGPSSRAQIPDGLIAAMTLLSQKPHQGVPTSTHTMYQGFGFVIANTALGMPPVLYDEGVRSRSTGKERDTESGNDFFGARYYNSATGRFLSPDWSASDDPVPYANLGDPQSLNLYGYALNNPLKIIDSDGHDPLIGDQVDAMLSQAWQATADARNLMASAAAEEARKKAPAQPPKSGPCSHDSQAHCADLNSPEMKKILDPNYHPTPNDVIGNGECVAACRFFTGLPDHTHWKMGPAVVGNKNLDPGTAIGTFNDKGEFEGNSATYIGPGLYSGRNSIDAVDQYNHPPHPPQARDIPYYSDPTHDPSNNSNAYHVIYLK